MNGKVERTTKDFDEDALIIIRERRCKECNEIHKTVEYSQDEINRKEYLRHEDISQLQDKINQLGDDLRDYNTLMNIIKKK